MKILPANPSHAADIARLIITAMTDDCCQFLVGPNHTLEDFYNTMLRLVLMDDSQYSWRNAFVAVDDEAAPDDSLSLGGFIFPTKKIKGKKTALLPLEQLLEALKLEKNKNKLNNAGQLRGSVITMDQGSILNGEKLSLIFEIAKSLDLRPLPEKKWNRHMNVDINDPIQKEQLVDSLAFILRTAIAKQKGREYGFITLYNNGNGSYWFKVSRGFSTALMESHSSLETLVEEKVEWSKEETSAINKALALVNSLYNA